VAGGEALVIDLDRLALLLARLGGVILLAPAFGGPTIPPRVRATVTLALTLALAPLAAAPAVRPFESLVALAAASEVLLGLSLGLGLSLAIAAVQLAGDIVADQGGLSFAMLIDPFVDQDTTAIGQVFASLATLLLLTLGGLEVAIRLVARTIEAVPLGGAVDFRAPAQSLIATFGALIDVAVSLAGPAIAVLGAATIALALASRAAPQVAGLLEIFPVKVGLVLFSLAAMAKDIAPGVHAIVARGDAALFELFRR
jgi:flagellar biosynthetic protein FliR